MSKKILFIALFFAALVSCGEKEKPDTGDTGGESPAGNVDVTFMPVRSGYIPNPLSGWVIYVPLIDNVDEFWEKYENFPSSEGTVNVFDYGHVIYLRGSWTDFNPEENVYIWQDGIDEGKYPLARSLRLFEEGAKERGLKLAFTLKTDSRDANANCTPDFVREKMDAAYGADAAGYLTSDGKTHTPGKGYFTFTLGTNPPRPYWSPYSDDPVFQQEYEKFINALAAEYDDPEITEFVSGLGMGKWGEYHTCIYSTGDATPKIPVFNWVTDTYINAFKQTPCFTNYHKMVGTIVGEGNGDPDSEGMLNSAIEKGFCMRHDAFGMRAETFGYASWEKKFIANWTYKVPVAGEGGWIVNQGYEDDKGKHNYLTQYDGPRELRVGEYEDMYSAYVNMMDLRYDASYTSGETWSWFNDAFDLVEKFVDEDCYRIYPDKVSVPSGDMVCGKEYTIQHRWLNIGHAYCPTNIKPYDGRFKVAVAILDSKTGEIVGNNIFLDENARPDEWTSGKRSYEMQIVPEGVSVGSYDLCIGIVDLALGDPDNGDYRIGIGIAADGDYTETGWLKLTTVNF